MDIYMTITQAETVLDKSILLDLCKTGRIRSSMLSNGVILVNKDDLESYIPLESRPEYQKYTELAGNEISLSDAARKYDVNQQTVSRWVAKGFIKRLGSQGRRVLIDESHIATMAAIYHAAAGGQGRWVFTHNGQIRTR